ncbi:MAG: FtsX-like permease family protein [Anaerolineales bacterium]
MPTIWRKVLADFWANKTRTFLMVLTITLGVFSVGYVGNMGALMNRDMEADYNSASPAQVTIYAAPLDETWVRELRKVPGVKNVEGRTQVGAQLVKANGEKIAIQFDAPKSLKSMQLNTLKPANPLDGFMPSVDKKEVIFDHSALPLGYQPGGVLQIELADGQKRKLTFKGYVHDVTTIPSGMGNTLVGYVTPETAEWLGGPTYYNELLVSVSENPTDPQHVTDVAHAITERFKNDATVSGGQIFVYNPGHHFAWQITQGVIFILSALGWMTVLLSAFLIVNTIVALMSQHVRQIGMMKAIGGGNGQIFMMYLALLLAFSTLALVISVPLAGWVAFQTCSFTGTYLNYTVGPLSFDASTVMMQIVLAFMAPLLAALAPLLNGLRIPVREALSDYGIGNASARNMRETVHLDFFPRPVLVSLRNAVRKKARLSLTLLALVLGGATFIAVFNLWLSFGRTMEDVQGYFLADINFTFTGSHYFGDVKAIAMQDPGVTGVEGWLSTNAEVMSADGKTSNEVAFMAPPSTSTLIQPVITEGRWLTPLDKNVVVIGNHLLKIRPELKVGDWITIKLQNEETQWQIIGVYRLPGNVTPPLLYTNYEYLSKIMHLSNKVYSLRVITARHDAGTQKTISNALGDAFRRKNIPVADVLQGAVWMAQQKSQTDVLIYFMLVMAVLIASVGGLGLMGMMSINVMERTREIGVMRAIGAADLDIQLIVIAEGLAVGLASWLAAVALSIPITYLLDYGVGVSLFQSPLPASFNWTGSLAWLAGILLVATLASAIPAWRASRLTVRDTLVYE